MKAVVFQAPKKVSVENEPDPKLEHPRDAIVRVSSAAICGSDLHMFDGYAPGMGKGDILGHEVIGEVVQVGEGLTGIRPGDRVVLNAEDPYSARLAARTPADVLYFALDGAVPQGAFLAGDELVLRVDGDEEVICSTYAVRLRGRHNLANILTAACCAAAAGASVEAIRWVATTFRGVPHRLEVVREWRGATFINDSIATSPERAVAALRAFDRPVILLAGGRDKHLPWEAWAEEALDRARAVVGFGEAASLIERTLREAIARRGGLSEVAVHLEVNLERAVERAAALANPGDVVLLSPGGTSFDAYKDFEARGARFRELVASLPEGA